MLAVKYDAVLVIIYIRWILKSPVSAIDRDWNDTMVLTGRMIQTPCITFIFHTKLTLRISRLFCQFCCRNGFRIFFRFTQIDGDIDLTILWRHFPATVFCNTILTDIVGSHTEVIIMIGRFLRVFCIVLTEFRDHLCRTRGQTVHQLCIKQISGYDSTILQYTALQCFIQKMPQCICQIDLCADFFGCRCLIIIFFHYFKNLVRTVNPLLLRDQTGLNSVLYQSCHI